MKIIKADGESEVRFLSGLRKRRTETGVDIESTVRGIITEIREHGETALAGFTKKFDGVDIADPEVPRSEVDKAYEETPGSLRRALIKSAGNIMDFHKRQVRQSFIELKPDGVFMGQRVRGLSKVGIYVPGGRAAYPSSVLMNAVPAKVANVGEIIMTAPPGRDGKIDQGILAAAKIAGVDRIFAAGGAQAIAAMAYGAGPIPRVDKIVGPGNAFVAEAKRQVFGTVDIDMIAGPSEILIVADESARPEFLAADLMSQAEHDPMASAVLLTTSAPIAQKTAAEIEKQISTLSRKDIIESSLAEYGAALVFPDIESCMRAVNEIAPEHLELMIENPMEYLGLAQNVGSVFLGTYSPEALGDYFAGPNHVLPTSGTARFFSPLSVDTFTKKSSFLYYTKDALEKGKDDIVEIAGAEGLSAHANSIKIRFPGSGRQEGKV